LTCSSSSTNCTSCKLPSTLTSLATCVICNDLCATCSPSNTSSCLTCKRPYSFSPYSSGCYRCNQDNCLKCVYANTSICLQCVAGSTLVNGVCQVCPSNCATCSTGNSPICFTCNVGYSLNIIGNTTNCTSCGIGCLLCD
jgi:hypothetical protein